MSDTTEIKFAHKMRYLFFLLAVFLGFNNCLASGQADTTYIIFKKDNLHQKITIDTNTYLAKCSDKKEQINTVKVFWYHNLLKMNNESKAKEYKFVFEHASIYDTLMFTQSNINKQKNELEALKKLYLNYKDTLSFCALEIKKNIEKIKDHLNSKQIINYSTFIDSHTNIISLDSILNSIQAESLMKKISNNIIFIIDATSECTNQLVSYRVKATSLLPIKSDKITF